MLRNAIFALGIAAAAVLVVPGAAQAADDSYTPSTPTAPTLSGSAAFVECVGNVPWIQFEVDAVDPDNQMSHQQVSLYMANGANSVELQLGTLSNNHLSGRVLWPGAAERAAELPRRHVVVRTARRPRPPAQRWLRPRRDG